MVRGKVEVKIGVGVVVEKGEGYTVKVDVVLNVEV